MKLLIVVCFAAAVLSPAQTLNLARDNGYVPDASTAIKIGEAVLIPVYGEKQIASERPFTAKLGKDGVWTVAGTLRCPDGKGGVTTMCAGGVAVVKLSKLDARIIAMTHYK